MIIKDIIKIDRETSFPIFACVYPDIDAQALSEYEPGRIILSHYETHTGVIHPSLIEEVKQGDIVFIPLYGTGGAIRLGDRWLAHDTSMKLPSYDRNIEIIREIAPRVRGVLVGNAGPELSFKEKWNGELIPRSSISMWMCDFAKETSDIIKSAGGTPVYGTIDWDVAIDCYFGNGMFRDLCNEIEAIQICFCGFQLLHLKLHDSDRSVPSPNDVAFWQKCPRCEQDPWPELTDYLKGTNEIWSGVDTTNGLINGFDIILKEHGFDAGVVGPPGDSFSQLLTR